MVERTGPTAAEQGRSIPAQLSRAPGQIFTPGQEIVAVAQKLAPSVRWDVGEWAMVVEARDPVDPTGRNATCSHIGRYFFWIKSFRIGVLDRCGLRDGRSRPPFQPPEPFTPIPKSVPNGFYAKKLLVSFEHFPARDALASAKQSCRSGHHLEFRYTQSILREGVSQKLGHLRFRGRTKNGYCHSRMAPASCLPDESAGIRISRVLRSLLLSAADFAHAEVECLWMKAPQRLRLSGLDAKPASMPREATRVSPVRTRKAERRTPPYRPDRTICIVQQAKDWGLRSTILRRSTRMPSARPRHARSPCHAQQWPCGDQSETANRRESGRYGRPVTVRSA